MKSRYFIILPLLLLSSCSNNRVVYNVFYYFDYSSSSYIVEYDDKKLQVKVENYYEIKVVDYKEVMYSYENIGLSPMRVSNEYFVDTQKLYVYIRQ